MAIKSELNFRYDAKSQPIGATCSICGKAMPIRADSTSSPADVIMELAERFIEHKKREHPVMMDDQEETWTTG
jgi:transcription elongation factor Elf1